MQGKEMNIYSPLAFFIRWRKLIILNFIIFSLLTIIYVLFLPKYYGGTVKFFFEQQNQFGFSSFINKLPFGIGGSTVISVADKYVEILQSRRLLDPIITKYNLFRVYEPNFKDDIYKYFLSDVEIEVKHVEGIIELTVFYKEDAKRAADIANEMIYQLDYINRELSVESAHNNRVFIENQYEIILDSLKKVEDMYKNFQEEYGIIELDAQAKSTIENMANLESEIYSMEIHLNILKKSVYQNSAEIKKIEIKLIEAKKQLFKLQNQNDPLSVIIPIKIVPELSQRYARFYRKLEMYKKLLEFILPELETAKIEEAKNTPTIQILDYAVPTDRKAKPKRANIVIAAAFFSIFFSIALALFLNLKNDFKNGKIKDEKLKYVLTKINDDINSVLSIFKRKSNLG